MAAADLIRLPEWLRLTPSAATLLGLEGSCADVEGDCPLTGWWRATQDGHEVLCFKAASGSMTRSFLRLRGSLWRGLAGLGGLAGVCCLALFSMLATGRSCLVVTKDGGIGTLRSSMSWFKVKPSSVTCKANQKRPDDILSEERCQHPKSHRCRQKEKLLLARGSKKGRKSRKGTNRTRKQRPKSSGHFHHHG